MDFRTIIEDEIRNKKRLLQQQGVNEDGTPQKYVKQADLLRREEEQIAERQRNLDEERLKVRGDYIVFD